MGNRINNPLGKPMFAFQGNSRPLAGGNMYHAPGDAMIGPPGVGGFQAPGDPPIGPPGVGGVFSAPGDPPIGPPSIGGKGGIFGAPGGKVGGSPFGVPGGNPFGAPFAGDPFSALSAPEAGIGTGGSMGTTPGQVQDLQPHHVQRLQARIQRQEKRRRRRKRRRNQESPMTRAQNNQQALDQFMPGMSATAPDGTPLGGRFGGGR